MVVLYNETMYILFAEPALSNAMPWKKSPKQCIAFNFWRNFSEIDQKYD